MKVLRDLWKSCVWAAAIATALGTVPNDVGADILTNCPQPVTDVSSCDVPPAGCWIESDREYLPWLVPPNDTDSNLKNLRAFCSPANATPGNSGHWYSYAIYLPPGYDDEANAGIHYPTVYWLMGSLSEPDKFDGRGTNVVAIVEQLTLKRRIRPAIYVIAWGGVTTEEPTFSWIDQWTDGHLPDDSPGCHPDFPNFCFRPDSAFDELIAHIEANYRVIPRALTRSLQGFSLGAGYALQRAFRTTDGNYSFGSVAALSAASRWESSRFDLDAEQLAVDFVNRYPLHADRPMQLLLKHGDLELDQSATPTIEFSDYLLEGILEVDGVDPGAEAFEHEYEHVIPQCGDERGFHPPCGGDLPPLLGHDQPRMTDLRGDEIIAFHQKAYQALTDAELAAIDAHRLPCAELLPFVTVEPPRFGSNEAYLVGDWDGDGCETLAVRHDGMILVDNDFDHFVDEELVGGPADASYFAIDWTDEGKDQLGFSRYDTEKCPNSLEIQLYTDDRDGDGHDAKDEPFFCFEDAPPSAEVLVGDFNGDFHDDIGYLVGDDLFWTHYLVSGYTGLIQGTTNYGSGPTEDQYTAGEWFPVQSSSGLGVRRGNELLLNGQLDVSPEIVFQFGTGNAEDQYVFGDWDGDGRTNVGVRRCSLFLLDIDFDGTHEHQYYFGWGLGECDRER